MHVVGGGILILGFQNCSKTSFGSSKGSTSSLQALSADGLTTPGGTTPPPVVTPPTEGTTTTGGTTEGDNDPIGSIPTDGSVCVAHPDDDGHEHKASTDKHVSCDNHEHDCESDKDSELVSCILIDNGKSLKLGLVTTSSLGGVDSVAEAVCISRTECLGDVAKAFNVKGAYDRGYCEHNPHVKSLTDAEVKTLLGI